MISAVILTKNEQNNIVDCIDQLSFCDEVIVVDDVSTDNTKDLAERLGAVVFEHSLDHDFSKARNFGLQKAKGEWILFVDADERISEELRQEILTNLEDPQAKTLGAFLLQREDIFFGKKLFYGETGKAAFIRLIKKGSGNWIGKVHEVWNTKDNIKKLSSPLLHYSHQSISDFSEDINFYTTLRAKELYEQGKKFHLWQLIIYPFVKFVVNYLLKQGFRDGIQGFILAIFMSWHSFLVRTKLWVYWKQD